MADAPPEFVMDAVVTQDDPGTHLVCPIIGRNSGIRSGTTSSCIGSDEMTELCVLLVAEKIIG